MLLTLGVCSCSEGASPSGASASVTGSASPSTSATPPVLGASASAPAPRPSAPAPDAHAAADAWLRVVKGANELGLIEVRVGKAPSLAITTPGEAASELEQTLTAMGDEQGVALKMHLPKANGEPGRGPLGARIVKRDDPLYATALRINLEDKGYEVGELPVFSGALEIGAINTLNIAREGKPVGSIDFAAKPPKLTLADPESADGMSLASSWSTIQKQSPFLTRFVHDQAGVRQLLVLEAKPNEPGYANAVRLHLIVLRWYDDQRKYTLEVR